MTKFAKIDQLPPNLRGSVDKESSDYLKMLKARTEASTHPRNNDVAMQAHHLISAKGVNLNNLGDRLEDLGYDINRWQNLVFIPNTLQGACLLQVQPHRGNHTATDAPDNDTKKDRSYHVTVARLVSRAMPDIEKACGRIGSKAAVEKEIDDISADLADAIQNDPGEAILTRLYANYVPGNIRGCRGVDSVRAKRHRMLDACPVQRNHTMDQGTGQAIEKISYVMTVPYVLTPGQ